VLLEAPPPTLTRRVVTGLAVAEAVRLAPAPTPGVTARDAGRAVLALSPGFG
jgi:hypothetical protein